MNVTLRIALAQMNIIPGRPDLNIERMLEMIGQAKQDGADLIAFPEFTISGYLIADKWLDEAFCRDMMAYNEVIREASEGIAVAWGNIYDDHTINQRVGDDLHHPNRDGRVRKYNAAVVAQNGQYATRVRETKLLPEGVQPKTLFPNYRFFDDERYFFSLNEIADDFGMDIRELAQPFLIDTPDGAVPVGFEICEDLWCQDYRKDLRALNVSRYLIHNGARCLVNLSASPWTIGKHDARDRRIRFLKQDMHDGFVPFLYVNNVGAQNNGKNIITFDGGSTAYNEEGKPAVITAKSFGEDLLVVDTGKLKGSTTSRANPAPIAQKYQAILNGIRHVRDMNGREEHPKFLVGLSGGVDSATVAALLVQAVGREKVMTVNMPSRYNSPATINAARHVAEMLDVGYHEVPIDNLVQENAAVFKDLDQQLESPEWMRSLSDENIQAKIRGTSILSNVAGRYGYMFTNNGNKVEIALGYVTLYGDVGGALAPIGDLTKSEVFDMARYLNQEVYGKEVIPETLLPDELFRYGEGDIQPSAELKEDQIDPMKFGYHCALLTAFTKFIKVTPEEVCKWYLDDVLAKKLNVSPALLNRWGLDDPEEFIRDLEWFVSAIQKNVFKRIQAPPIIVTSTSAYGFDIRESQLPVHFTKEYLSLKQQILGK